MAFIQTDWGQNWTARRVVTKLSRDLQTKINIKHVSFTLFNKMNLEGVYVEDQKKDTLLYAGTVQVRITDWFFFKDKADLKYIGLEDATIFFNRTDSVWNYQFLDDYFGTPANPNKKKKSAGIQFNLQKIDLQNVAFKQNDAWLGNNLLVKVGALDMDVHDLSISRKTVVVSNVDIEDPFFSTYSYKGKFSGSSKSSPFDWIMSVNQTSIKNGRLKIDNGDLTPDVSYFDSRHLDFSKINGNIKNLHWQNEIITANLNLSTRERSGLHVKSLKTDLKFSPHEIVLNRLFLQTNRSTIGNYFAMRFKSLKSLDNFEKEVNMEARLNKSSISSDDIAFFAPEARTWNRMVKVSGVVKGTVAALNGSNMDVWAGNDTHLNGNISLAGLPNIDRTYIRLDAKDLRTTYRDLVSFAPALKKVQTPNLSKLSYLQFTGTYTGFFNDFTTNGLIKTNLGNIQANISMKFPAKGDPSYSGTLSTGGFELGRFINDNDLGVLAFNGSVKGRGFDWRTMNMNVNGVVQKFRYQKYTYQNIAVRGTINKRKFNGDFAMKDPNADLHLSGLLDFTGERPLINATAEINFANLKKLQLTSDEIIVRGSFKANIQGSNLSNLLGTARIHDASIVHNGNKLSFDSLYVFSNYVNGVKTLKAVSNEFDVTVAGNFDIGSLPDAFKMFLHRYYPSYIEVPRYTKPQNFTFNIKTGVVEDYIRLIDPRLTGFNNSEINGSLNIAANTMTIDANVPYFAYQNHEFSDVILKGSGDFQRLSLTGQVGNAVVDSSRIFPQTNFTISAANDVSDVNIQTTSNLAVNQANLSAQLTTYSDGFSVLVHPSSFIIKGKTWTIQEGGELTFRRNAIVHGELVLRESQQEIIVQSVPSSLGTWNDLHVSLRNINLNDVSPFIFKDNNLEGTLTGEIVVEDPANKFLVTANLHAEQLRLDNDSLGRVDIVASYDNRTGLLVGRGSNADPDHHIDFDIAMNLKSSDLSDTRISLHPKNFQLKFLERFIGSIFTDIVGTVTGDVDIIGDKDHLDFVTNVRLKDAGLKVVFTQVTYKILDTDLRLSKDYLDLSGITLQDANGNTAKVTGGIRHKAFNDMYFDIAVKTQSERMELLNTTYQDNQTFYGRAKGAGTFVLVGPQYDMNMFIDAKASETDSSSITLPPVRSRETGQADFMVEKKYGREMAETDLRGASTNITYQVNLDVNPMVNVEVILDELTGDIIRARGTSQNFEISSGTSAPLTISGRFDIEEGDYLFTFQSVFKRPFILRRGANNYIQWTRDPYDATVNLEAIYRAENVSFAPLATTLLVEPSVTKSLAQLREDVDVIATLTGKLFQPKFSFKLEFPNSSNVFNNPAIAFGIQQLQNNPNELYKQVTYLIVTNSFAPYETTRSEGLSTNPLEEFTFSTVSGLFFNVLNKELNQIFSRIFRNNKFTFNFSGSVYNRNLFDPNARNIRLFNQVASNVSIGTSLLNGRAIFTVGGTFDMPLSLAGDVRQNIQLLPDVTLEVLLNKIGTLRATFFYRQNVDFLYGNTTAGSPTTKRFGAGISYNKEFDSLSEVLFGKKRVEKKDTTTTAPVETSSGTNN